MWWCPSSDRSIVDGVASEGKVSTIKSDQSGDHMQQGALAGTVWTYQGYEFSWRHSECYF
tara:strand:- start:475 stop:654 length:180 start_codon:yes stop_codon:yes gene_type:complete